MVLQLMGRDPVWGFTKLVQMGGSTPLNPAAWVAITGADGEQSWLKLSSPIGDNVEYLLFAAVGPLAALLGALLGLVLVRRTQNVHW